MLVFDSGWRKVGESEEKSSEEGKNQKPWTESSYDTGRLETLLAGLVF